MENQNTQQYQFGKNDFVKESEEMDDLDELETSESDTQDDDDTEFGKYHSGL